MREAKAGPLRWRVAGRLAASAPQVRGSDRAVLCVRGRGNVQGRITGRLTNGLRFDFQCAQDPTINAFIELQYRPPTLVPILEAALIAGACFYDIGANVGLYSVWASKLVGPTGDVVSFEPAPATGNLLRDFVRLNRSANIQIVPSAVGAEKGAAWLQFDPDASAQANIVAKPVAASLQVPVVRLDDFIVSGPAPTLVKIDVEGYELQVLQGGHSVWARYRPIIVLEVIPAHLERNGTSFSDITRQLDALDYTFYNLTPKGLTLSVGAEHTMNVLALCADMILHRDVRTRLARTRFARNQTV